VFSLQKELLFFREQKVCAQRSCFNKFRTGLTNEQLGRTRMYLVRLKYRTENFESRRAYKRGVKSSLTSCEFLSPFEYFSAFLS